MFFAMSTLAKGKEKMAFTISRSRSTFSESEKANLDHLEDKDSATMSDGGGAISSQLQLKSSSQTLDKQVVLRRIRQRKSFNKVKGAFESLLGSSKATTASAHEQMWFQQGDAFSAP